MARTGLSSSARLGLADTDDVSCWGPSVGSLAVPRLSPLTVTAVKRASTLSCAGKSRPHPQLPVFGHPPCMLITAGPLTFCPGASSSGRLGLRNVWHLPSTREGEEAVSPLSVQQGALSSPFHAATCYFPTHQLPEAGLRFISTPPPLPHHTGCILFSKIQECPESWNELSDYSFVISSLWPDLSIEHAASRVSWCSGENFDFKTPSFPDPLSLSLHPLPRARYPELTCAPVKSLSLRCATGLPYILGDALSQGPWRCGPVWGFPRFPCLFVEACSRFFKNGCALPQMTVLFVEKGY